MQHEHHDLIHEFPEYREEIHNLKTTNEHFREIFDAYHKIDKEVYRRKQYRTPVRCGIGRIKEAEACTKGRAFSKY